MDVTRVMFTLVIHISTGLNVCELTYACQVCQPQNIWTSEMSSCVTARANI